MAKLVDCVEIRFPNRKEYVGVVRLAVSGLAHRCNFTLDEVEDLKIAVSEACTNAVIHGYNGKQGEIVVRCLPQKNSLTVEVQDKGVGFDPKKPKKADANTKGKKAPSLGLGLTFIQSLTDQMKVTSAPRKGTTVRFTKKHS